MEFEILVPLRVRSNGGDLKLGAPAQRELLAVLLTSPNVTIPDARLVDELWGDDPPPSARHLVHVYVSRLRAILGDLPDGPRVVREGTGYAVRVAPNELNAERFVANLERGRALREREPKLAERALAEGIGLWRGTPFVDLPTTPPAVGDEVGLTVPPGADLSTVIGRRLRHRPVLPLLDNCEHVAQAIAALGHATGAGRSRPAGPRLHVGTVYLSCPFPRRR